MIGCLIGLHTFSGCDSTSSFFGHGKASIFKLAVAEEACRQQLASLGDEWDASQVLHSSLDKFACRLYGQPVASSLTEARYSLFSNKTSSEKLLPLQKLRFTNTPSGQTTKLAYGSGPCRTKHQPQSRLAEVGRDVRMVLSFNGFLMATPLYLTMQFSLCLALAKKVNVKPAVHAMLQSYFAPRFALAKTGNSADGEALSRLDGDANDDSDDD